MALRTKGDFGFSSAGDTITRSTTERISLAEGRSPSTQGISPTEIASLLGIGRTSVYRALGS